MRKMGYNKKEKYGMKHGQRNSITEEKMRLSD